MKPGTAKHKINEHSVSLDELYSLASEDHAAIHFGQSAEDVFLLRFFYQKKNGFYVDIGSYSPTRYSNTYLLHSLYGWSGINIDASEDVIEEFRVARKNDINICAAVGKPSTRTFYSFEASARNTLSRANVERQSTKGDTSIVSKDKIHVRSLKDILKENLPDNQQIDIIDIDVEGLEMEVLQSNDWSLYRPRLILLEDYSIGQGKVAESEIYNFMIDKNYTFIGHHFDTSFYTDKSFKGKELEPIDRHEFISNLHNLNTEHKEHRLSIQKLTLSNKELKDELQALYTEKTNMEKSLSWRATKPFRKIKSLLKSS